MCKSGCHGCPALHRRKGPLAPHDNHSVAEGHRFCHNLVSNHLLCCWSAHKSLAPRTRTLLGVLGQATLNFVAVATLLFFFSVSVLNFATSPNSGVKFFWGFLRSEKSILRFIFSGCASFSWFFFLLLRSSDADNLSQQSRLWFPATPGWGVRWWWWWVAPRHTWLGALVGCSFATPGRGSRVQFPATPGWGPPAAAVAVSVGGGFHVLCVLVAQRVRVVSVLVCVVCVCGVCVGGGAGVGVCVCVCVCVVCWWRVVAGPCLRRLLLALVGVWLACAVVGPSPLLAEVPVCVFPPLLAAFRCRWWWVSLATPGWRPRVRFPATPGSGPPVVVVCGPLPLLAAGPGWAPRHSWLGSAGCGGVLRGWGCPVLCVFEACVAARGGRAVLCVVCLWCPCCWWCGVVVQRGCVFRVPWFARLRVRPVPVVCGSLSPPLSVWGSRLVSVWVWLSCGVGPPPLLAEGPRCSAPPLLAGVCRCAVVVGPLPQLAKGLG